MNRKPERHGNIPVESVLRTIRLRVKVFGIVEPKDLITDLSNDDSRTEESGNPDFFDL